MKLLFLYPKIQTELYSFEKPTIAKFIKLAALLQEFGTRLGMPYARRLKPNLYELRIRGHQEVRIFYCFDRGDVIFLHSFIKKTRKTPAKEINTALSRMRLLTLI